MKYLSISLYRWALMGSLVSSLSAANGELWQDDVTTNKTETGKCSSDNDCSLNGKCNNNHQICECDKPWSGTSCALLETQPVKFPQGYGMTPNVTTWGGGILYEQATQKHHLYVSRMTNDCPLAHWTTNSRVDHAVSTTGAEGPYSFQDVAINTFAHNPAPMALPDGTFAILHIGKGEGAANGGVDCSKNSGEGILIKEFVDPNFSSTKYHRRLGESKAMESTIHTSKSLDGPWEPLQKHDLGDCNNPSPWIHPNGTIFVLCGSQLLKRAENIAGPYTNVPANLPPKGVPNGVHLEDAQLWSDTRGNFHVLYHAYKLGRSDYCGDALVALHAYSQDGLNWDLSPIPPYTTQLAVLDNDNKSNSTSTMTLATRERPKLFFDEDGRITHMVQGVCGSPFCEPWQGNKGCVNCKYLQWDFTLVVPLA